MLTRFVLALVCTGGAIAAHAQLPARPASPGESRLPSRIISDPATTNIGGWQSQAFDPAKLFPIGVWELVGGHDSASILNRRVRALDADNPTPMHPHWSDPYERWRRVWSSWRERFDGDHGDIAPVIEWLRPGWFGSTPPALTERRPVILFWAPHGKLDEARAQNMDFYSAIEARDSGLDYLVDGFYEGCRRLDALGVKVIKHDGSPGHDRRDQLMGAAAFRRQHALNVSSNAAVGLDAIVLRPSGGVDERTGDDYWSRGQGCLMEGVPDPTDPGQGRWLDKPWPIVCTYGNAAPRVFQQASWAVGKWPVAGTPEFDKAYGPERRFFWCLYLTEWGDKSFDKGWSSKEAALRFISPYADHVQEIFTRCPRSIVLLPKGLPELCARWGVPVERFLPKH